MTIAITITITINTTTTTTTAAATTIAVMTVINTTAISTSVPWPKGSQLDLHVKIGPPKELLGPPPAPRWPRSDPPRHGSTVPAKAERRTQRQVLLADEKLMFYPTGKRGYVGFLRVSFGSWGWSPLLDQWLDSAGFDDLRNGQIGTVWKLVVLTPCYTQAFFVGLHEPNPGSKSSLGE